MVQYRRPRTVEEALDALNDANGSGRPLVGGTDLLVGVRRQPLEPLVLIDLKAIEDFPAPIEITDNALVIGPTATMTDLSTDPRINGWFPALVSASRVVGSVAIRNRATVVGNICHASPACDTGPSLLVYGATVTVAGSAGERRVALKDFFVGPGQTICTQGELVIGVEIPIPDVGFRSAFQRLTRRRGVDLATVSVAAGVSGDGAIKLGLGAVGPTPLLTETSDPLDHDDPQAVKAAITELTRIATPISDVRARQDYREAMTVVLAERAVEAATQSEGATT